MGNGASWVGTPAWSATNGNEYSANTVYTYSAPVKLQVVNHFCTAKNANDGCDETTDNVLSGTSGSLDVNGYSIGYLLPPVEIYSTSELNTLIPPLVVSDDNSVNSYLPATYKINAKNANTPVKTGNLMGMTTSFAALAVTIQAIDFNAYENKIHFYYVNGVGASANIKVVNAGSVAYDVDGIAYDADGTSSKQVYSKTINVNETVSLPVTPAIMLKPAPYGYTLGWSLEFGYKTATTTNDVVNEHLVDNSNVFAANYASESWKISNRTETDKVYLDTIYNGLLKAFAVAQTQQTSVSGEDFKITITPELTAKNYSVTFDLGDKFDKDSLLVFSDKVLSQWNVVTGTTAQATMQSGEKFSRAYIYTKENTTFQELLWTNANQSATGYSELSSTLLHDAASGDNSMIELTLHPVRGDAASNLINVRAYDDNGVLLTTADDYHGSVILSQKVGSIEFKQESHLEQSGSDYAHALYVPNPKDDDTLTFDVSTKVDYGYVMNLPMVGTLHLLVKTGAMMPIRIR